MKVAVVSPRGMALGLLARLGQEDHEVAFWTEAPKVYEGLFPRAKSQDVAIEDAAVVVADGVNIPGPKVIGAQRWPTGYSERLATFAQFRMPAKMNGRDPGRTIRVESARRWKIPDKTGKKRSITVEEHTTAYAQFLLMKPHLGDQITLEKESPGLEFCVEKWFSRGKVVEGSTTVAIKTRRFLAGDLGPETECESTCVFPWDNKLTDTMFPDRLRMVLQREQVSGPVHVEGILIDGEVEWQCFCEGFSWGGSYAFLRLLKTVEMGKFFADVARGQARRLDLETGDFAGNVRVTIPPYPSDSTVDDRALGTIPVKENVSLIGVRRDDDADLTACGPVVMEITAHAKDLLGLDRELRASLDALTLPERQYRIDFLAKALREFPQLRQAAGMTTGQSLKDKKESRDAAQHPGSHGRPPTDPGPRRDRPGPRSEPGGRQYGPGGGSRKLDVG